VTTYISIGNSDDRLTQHRWAWFWRRTDDAIRGAAEHVYGAFVSEPTQPYQNACWSVSVFSEDRDDLRSTLRAIAADFGQDSIAWCEADTELLSAVAVDPEALCACSHRRVDHHSATGTGECLIGGPAPSYACGCKVFRHDG
jgi:hypothetical protein